MSKIRICAIGVGRLGFLHASNLNSYIPEVDLIAICSRSEATVSKVKQKLNVATGYTNYHEMLEKEKPAAVFTSPANEPRANFSMFGS